MRVRWVIEHGLDRDPPDWVYLTLVNAEGDNVVGPIDEPNEEAAKRDATESCDGETLTWKPAPKEWQPDTYLVSNYYDDPGWDR